MSESTSIGKIGIWATKVLARLATAAPMNEALAPTLVETITQLLPNRRMEKVEELLVALQTRLDKVDPPLVKDRPFPPIFPDLLEDGCLHATRAASSERLDYIAAMIVSGITRGEARRLDYRYLMQLLAELNDVQVLLLIASAKGGTDADEFWRQHQHVLAVPLDGPGATTEDTERAAVYDSYREHLERLGLATLSPSAPSVAKYDGNREDGHIRAGALRVAPLGRLVLEAIDQQITASDADAPVPPNLPPDRVDAFWQDFVPVLRETLAELGGAVDGTNAHVTSSIQGINFQAVYESSAGQRIRTQGYINSVNSQLWAESSLSTGGGYKILVHLGADRVGVYWQHGQRKRTSLGELARLLTAPIGRAIYHND